MLKNLTPPPRGNRIQVYFLVYGGVCLVAQLVLIRELSVIFYSNELFLGFSLGAWLFWVGLGSSWGQHVPPEKSTLLYALFGSLLPLEIIAIRLSSVFFRFGTLAGPLAMLLGAGLLFFPIAALAGSLFSIGCNLAKTHIRIQASRIYFLETAGAVAGGFIYTYFLAGRFSNWDIAAGLAFLATVSFLLLSDFFGKTKIFWAAAILTALSLCILCLPFWDTATRRFQWRGYEVVDHKDSRFSNIVLTKTGDMRQLFQDGLISSTFPDPRLHEEIIHWPLLAHPDPQKVLILGSGATGEIREILKHPVRAVRYVEIDRDLLSLLTPHLAPEDRRALRDPRVQMDHEDGRAFLKRTTDSVDVIILNLPEPANAQNNRFYTREFFTEAHRHLRPGGLLAVRTASAENYLPPENILFLRSVFYTLKSVFRQVSIIPGQPLILIAQDSTEPLSPHQLEERYTQRKLVNFEMVPTQFEHRLNPDRVAFVENELMRSSEHTLNTDFAPVSYYYFWKLWLLKFQDPKHFILAILLAAVFLWGFKVILRKHRRGEFAANTPALAVVFLLGLSGIVYEILLLLTFQALQGYVYWQLGLLFAAFMIGLALGSGLGSWEMAPFFQTGYLNRFLLIIQSGYGLALGVLLYSFHLMPPIFSAPVFFSCLMIPAGFIPGLGFSLLSRTVPAGGLYAADLWGGALGAFLTGLVLVPLFGVFHLIWVFSAVLLTAGVLLRLR